jgi:hypothetical protein
MCAPAQINQPNIYNGDKSGADPTVDQSIGCERRPGSGRCGVLFKLAKDRLGAVEFSQIAQEVLGAEELSNEAPQIGACWVR